MEKEQLLQMLAKKGVSGCCMGTLGFALGHLTDHGLDEDEVRATVEFILQGIAKVKNNPADLAIAERFINSVVTTMKG